MTGASLTRREAMAASLGGLAASSSGTAPVAAAAADPVFPLIEAHRTARERLDRASAAEKVIRDQLPADLLALPKVAVARRRTPAGVETVYVRSHEQIDGNREGLTEHWIGQDDHWAAWAEARHQELDEVIAEKQRARDAAGLTAAEAEVQEADDAEAEAMSVLIEASATTLPGALAYARYMLAYERRYLGDFDDLDPGYRIVIALERSISTIAVA